MGEVGRAVGCLDHAFGVGLRLGDGSLFKKRVARLAVQRRQQLVFNLLGVKRALCPLLPLHIHRQGGLARVPGGLADHGKAGGAATHGVECHQLQGTGHGQRRFGVQRGHGATQHRALAHLRVQHAGQAHIQPELRAAIGLGRNVAAGRFFADQLPVFAVFQRDGARGRARRRSGQGTVMGRHAGGVRHQAIHNPQFLHWQLPLRGGRTQQAGPCRGSGGAHRIPGVGHARRASGNGDA